MNLGESARLYLYYIFRDGNGIIEDTIGVASMVSYLIQVDLGTEKVRNSRDIIWRCSLNFVIQGLAESEIISKLLHLKVIKISYFQTFYSVCRSSERI